MAKNKHQHFVPQFYLRNFAPNRSIQICVYNFARKKHISGASIKGQCSKDCFYDRDGVVEDRLRMLEDEASEVISEIVRNSHLPSPLTQEHATLLTFIAFQASRTPESGRIIEEGLLRMFERVVESSNLSQSQRDDFMNRVRLATGDSVSQALSTATRRAMLIEDLSMHLLVNCGDPEFITSDFPVAFRNQWGEKMPGMGTDGFCCQGLQVFLPLSVRKMLMLFDNSIYELVHPGSGPIEIRSTKDIESLNTLHLFTADENLYYSGDLSTRMQIDGLPLEKRMPKHMRTRAARAVEEGGHSELVHGYTAAPSIPLDTSFLSLRHAALQAPHHERGHKFRKESMRKARILFELDRGHDDHDRGPRVFRRIKNEDNES